MSRYPQPDRPQRPPLALGFSDRVMAQVAAEPRPTPARVVVRSALRLQLGDAWSALATAAHLAFGRTGPIPALVRMQSLVLLLAFTVALGAGSTLAAAGAIGVIESQNGPLRVDRPLVLPPASPSPRASVPPRPTPPPAETGLSNTQERSDAGDAGRPRDGQTRDGQKKVPPQPQQKKQAPKSSNRQQQPSVASPGDRASSRDGGQARDSRAGPASPRAPEPAAKGGSGPVRDQEPGSDRGS